MYENNSTLPHLYPTPFAIPRFYCVTCNVNDILYDETILTHSYRLPAWSGHYRRHALLPCRHMALLFTPILIMGVVLLIKNPELLRKRMEMKEREKEQRGVVTLSGLLLVGSFIVAGLDFRFG